MYALPRYSLVLPLLTAIAFGAVSACAQTPQASEPAASERTSAEDEQPEYWRALGQQSLAAALARPRYKSAARGIILFVGDGMGVSTITAARIYAGQVDGGRGEETSLGFEQFPYTSLIKTYNVNQQTPDSAGTMSAMMTGVKTDSGLLSVGPATVRMDCESGLANTVPTLMEQLEAAGWSTGVVSTARLTHATPAAAYGHAPERGWEDDSALPKSERGKGCKDLALQLVEMSFGDGLEVALGGGRRHFLPRMRGGQPFPDPENPRLTGRRLDGRHLGEEWAARPRSEWIWNQEQFDQIDIDAVDHLLGTFNHSHMQYELDRENDPGGEPSLAEMTALAIRMLSRNPNGFLLVVESGRIDHAHHATNAVRAFADTVALDAAVAVADDMTVDDETLLLVTADHSHVMTIAGYASRGNPILDIVRGNDRRGDATGQAVLADDERPYTTITYGNGRGGRFLKKAVDEYGNEAIYGESVNKHRRLNLAKINTTLPGYHQESFIPSGAETHGGEDVALFAKGPWAHLVSRTEEQSYIYYVMRHASGIDAAE
ncbi:MAG: alkaline phosphatase [Pseudomonadota bacterium]